MSDGLHHGGDAVTWNAPVHEPLVACILVTWNNWGHTERCLQKLSRQDYSRLLVIVVDNGSTDDSLLRLRAAYPSAICIENGYNYGFAKACNIGALRGIKGGAQFLWFLNNDTEAPPDTARKLVAKANIGPEIGIVGAVLFYMDEPERVQAWGGGEISRWSGYNRHFTAPHGLGAEAYITFASALVRRQTFEELQGLWEGLFMYFEDADFCLRAFEAGWKLAIAEDTAILHAESASLTSPRGRNLRRDKIQTASGILFLERHGPIPMLSVVIFLALRIGRRTVRGEWAALQGVLESAGQWWRGRLDHSGKTREA